MFQMDDLQRVDLTAIHALAGGSTERTPSRFLQSEVGCRSARELGIPAPATGTWHPVPLALAYAGWLDPALAARLAVSTSNRLSLLLPEFQAARDLAVQCGLDGNQAVLSACRAVHRTTGHNPVELLGLVGLKSNDVHFSVTELGKHLGCSAREVNTRLADLGLQDRLGTCWTPTDEGREYAVILDVGKPHSDGTPVTQLRWRMPVLGLLQPLDLLGGFSGSADAPARHHRPAR